MFRRIVHCDWSKNAGGRWRATARRDGAGWIAEGPEPVPASMPAFVSDLLDPAKGPTLAAFDFPIGLPLFLRGPMGGCLFVDALDAFGRTEPLGQVLVPADALDEVSMSRPFYPDKPGRKGEKPQEPWRRRLGAAGTADLLRACEKGGEGARAAGCMLWLTGARTVGKAAIHGWTEVIRPARAEGARLWPFEGNLPALAAEGSLVLAESYPADACRQIGLAVKAKTVASVLEGLAPALVAVAQGNGIALSRDLHDAIRSGFAAFGGRRGDAFDAVAGLIAAVAVAAGAREAAPRTLADEVRQWEGWILGRRATR